MRQSPLHDPFRSVELAVYWVLGALLSATAFLALAGAGKLLWEALGDWTSTASIFQLMDRLLFVLMLVEILHTVRTSMRSGVLVCEPFLIVGLIATIRRMLVITLESSEFVNPDKWASGGEAVFQASMLELGLLAVLILVLVTAIYMLRRSPSSELTEHANASEVRKD